jgi:hypothetical protein
VTFSTISNGEREKSANTISDIAAPRVSFSA